MAKSCVISVDCHPSSLEVDAMVASTGVVMGTFFAAKLCPVIGKRWEAGVLSIDMELHGKVTP